MLIGVNIQMKLRGHNPLQWGRIPPKKKCSLYLVAPLILLFIVPTLLLISVSIPMEGTPRASFKGGCCQWCESGECIGGSYNNAARASNYSFVFTTNGSEQVFYLVPGETREVMLVITNTGNDNDSYYAEVQDNKHTWPYAISDSISPILKHQEKFYTSLNVTAPQNLFLYPREYTFEIETTSISQPGLKGNISLFFILSSIKVGMEMDIEDEVGEPVTRIEIEESENVLLYLEITNTGNISDVYDITLSGLSQGWDAFFRTGERKISVELASGGGLSILHEVLVIRCSRNSTENSPLVIMANSTISELIPEQSSSEVLIINLEKHHRTNPIILGSEVKYYIVGPDELVNVPLLATNFGSNGISFKPSINNSLPEWIEVMDSPSLYNIVPEQTSAEYQFVFYVHADAPADSELLITFSGSTRERYGQVFDTWIHLRVKQVSDLTASIDAVTVKLTEGITDSLELTLINNGNGREKVDIYPIWDDSYWVNISERTLYLLPFETGNVTIELSIKDPLNAVSGKGILHVVSLRDSHVFEINVTIIKESPQRFVDLTLDEEGLFLSEGSDITGGYRYLNFTVVNRGTNDSGPFDILVQTKNKLDGISQSLLEKRENNLAPGDTLYFSIPLITKKADWKIEVEIDSGFIVEESSEANNIFEANIYIDDFEPETSYGSPPGGSYIPTPVYIGGGGVVLLAVIISIVYAFGGESLKYSMVGLIVPLYSKLAHEDILSHTTRERVYRFVKNHPGEHYRSILVSLDLKNGTLTYHLNTLEKREFIISERDGPYRRFFPCGARTGKKIYINGLRKEIYDFLLRNPGLSQKKISQILECSPPTVNYHINNLMNQGLVKMKRRGRETHCFAINSQKVQ